MGTDPECEPVPSNSVSKCGARLDHTALAASRNRPQLRRRSKLWDWIEFLKCRCERVRQAPHSSGSKLLMLWIEIELVSAPRQVFRDLQIPLNECPVDRQLGRLRVQL